MFRYVVEVKYICNGIEFSYLDKYNKGFYIFTEAKSYAYDVHDSLYQKGLNLRVVVEEYIETKNCYKRRCEFDTNKEIVCKISERKDN